MSGPVLEVRDLSVEITGDEPLRAVRNASFTVARGECVCLVGESGCGKSLTALAVMGLLPREARLSAERLAFAGEDLLRASPRRRNRLRGSRMAMVFQEPTTALNPAYTIGNQLAEVHRRHCGSTRGKARERAVELLDRVGIAAPGQRLSQYPHQFSGGERQRVMIAMALMCSPDLLIADEPTTALDVTVQAQILRLLAELRRDLGVALLLITHDLAVVARIADRVHVMYAGEIVENAAAADLFAAPRHPYTRGLLGCIPVPGRSPPGGRLGTIRGTVPALADVAAGCPFRSRCDHARELCAATPPERTAGPGHHYRCIILEAA